MSGNYYSTSVDAEYAFQSKNMLNNTIILNEDNPSEMDLDYTTELYKVLMMAHYLTWDEIGLFLIIPLDNKVNSFQNNQYLKFNISTKKCFEDIIIWTVETNASPLDLPSVIDALLKKRNIMINRYMNTHSKNEMDILTPKLSGVLNRDRVIPLSSILGDWVATYKSYVKKTIDDEPWYILTTKDSIEHQFITPEYSLKFTANNKCILGGNMFDAIQAECFYDSMHNIIVSSNKGIAIAYVTSLYKDVLTLIIRCQQNENGDLSTVEYDDLLLLKNKRLSDLKKHLDS